MAWDNIEQRLKQALPVEISFPAGTVWLPDSHLTIDEWLTSLAESSEELRELNIPRIRFLQNHWRMEKLVRIAWEDRDHRTIWAMYIARMAYIIFSDGVDYQLIAAMAPGNSPSLYRAVISKLLQNESFVPEHPSSITVYRADLAPDIENILGGPVESMRVEPDKERRRRHYLSDLLVGWIGKWIDLPVLGFWHEEGPESIEISEKGKYVMRYKPSYGDKQRDEQKRRKEEEPEQNRQPEEDQKQTPDESKTPQNPADPKKHVA